LGAVELAIQAVSRFSVRPAPDVDQERTSSLLRDGQPTGTVVPGCVLEAQYEIGSRALLFVTHDIPYEETLEILLLDAAGGIVDRASLSRSYVTGSFVAGEIIDDTSVTFRFFGGPERTVRVLANRELRLPFSEPPGTHRPRGLFRWFRIV